MVTPIQPDPTPNVLDLVRESVESLRREQALLKELFDAKAAHHKEVAKILSEQAKEIRVLESSRLDAILKADSVAREAEARSTQTAVRELAQQTTDREETLRKQVQSTAEAQANAQSAQANAQTAQMTAVNAAVNARLAALELALAKGEGKQAVADPMNAELVSEIKSLRKYRDTSAGKSAGLSMGWAILLGVVSLIGGMIGIIATGVAVFMALR